MRKFILFLFILLTTLVQAQNTKISALPSGSPALTTDATVIARAGANYKLTLQDIINISTNWPAVTGIAVYGGSTAWGTSVPWNVGTTTATMNITGDAGGTATNATNISTSVDATNANYSIVVVPSTSGNQAAKTVTGFTINPSTGAMSAPGSFTSGSVGSPGTYAGPTAAVGSVPGAGLDAIELTSNGLDFYINNVFVGTLFGTNGIAKAAALPVMVGDSGTGGTQGAAPAPAAGDAAAGKFLSAYGDYRVPPAASGMVNPMTTTGDIIYGSTTASPSTPSRLGIGTQYQVLQAGASLPTYGAVHLDQAAAVTGILPVGNGGLGLATLTAHALYAGNAASAPSAIAVPAADSMLYGTTGADPSFKAMPTTGTNGCSGTGEALQWNNSTHAWGCTTITGGSGNGAYVVTSLGGITAATYMGTVNASATFQNIAAPTHGETFNGLFCTATVAPGVGNTWTMFVSTATPAASPSITDGAVTCSITGTNLSCSDPIGTHSVAVAANTWWAVHATVGAGAPSSARIYCNVTFGT